MSITRSGIPLLALLAVGCDAPTALGPAQAGLHLDVEGTLADTIFAPASRIRIWLADSSVAPIADAWITFSYPDGLESWEMPWWITFDRLGTGPFDRTTNRDGGLSFFVHRTHIARSAWVRVQATSEGITWADSVLITTLPGLSARVAMPVDSAIYQGNSAVWRTQVTDREGNARSTETATIEAGTPGIEVTGTTVTALAGPSRQMVRAKLNGVPLDSTWLSIVPPGEIVVVVDRPYDAPYATWRFARLSLDGSVFEEVVPKAFVGGYTDLPAQWMPDGESIVFRSGLHIARKTIGGAIDTVLVAPAGYGLHCPMPSSDGLRIFAHRIWLSGSATDAWAGSIATQGADGAVVGPPRTFGSFDTCPSPSPDGQLIAVASDRNHGQAVLYVLGIDSPLEQRLGFPSFPQARWSPDGNWLVSARDGTLYAVRPNGNDYHQLGTGSGFEAWASWSSDSKWIAVERHGPVIEIINVETGLRLPLGFTGYLRMPSWRPTPAP